MDSFLNRKAEALGWLEACGMDWRKYLKAGEIRFRKHAFLVLVALPVLLFISWLTSDSGDPARLLQRGNYGDPSESVTLQGELTASGQTVVHEFHLEVQNAELDEEVAFALFDQCGQWLSETLFFSGVVNGDLILPSSFENGMVTIDWESSDPYRITGEGQVNLLNLPETCTVVMTAVLTAGHFTQREDFSVSLLCDGGDYTASLKRYAQNLEKNLNESTDGETLRLPEEDGQVRIRWIFPGRKTAFVLIPLAMLILICLYVLRFQKLASGLKKQKEVFRREIPSFTMQLVLLLNGGLVADQAFCRLLAHRERNGPLYTAVRTVWKMSKEQNLSFFSELYIFARKTGIRDFIRIAAILHDNAVHGSELGSRLERERELLWNDRLSAAKASAGRADTKLCFPLVLLLLSLILLTAAPAFLNV